MGASGGGGYRGYVPFILLSPFGVSFTRKFKLLF